MALNRLIKPTFLALFGSAWLWTAGPALAAGTTPLAMAQQIDANGQPLANCQVNFYVAGTVSTRQNVFADYALSQPLPNPLSCDQTGRVPMHWLADGLIHVQLTDSAGNPVIDTTMQVLGPSSGGGGGGGTVDPTTIAQTGDEKIRYDNTIIAGWVRENGLTIGNATSGATERANADTQNLFVYLYNKDPNLVVSGGRTGNALNDYNASKTIAVPDMRGRVVAGLADMGNTAAPWLTSTYLGASPTTLGVVSTTTDHTTLLTTNLPPYTPLGNVTTIIPSTLGGEPPYMITPGGCCVGLGGTSTGATSFSVAGDALTSSFNGAPQGGSNTPFANLPPMMLQTFYIKL